ncbi:unannotated protein [freshwater metagenome]|uniref:Unannotated protein n=1 Tax=freshwater metagenome TaxID=449393 RepID=A0A6J7ISG2_9ZZZZ
MLLKQAPAEPVEKADHGMLDITETEGVAETAHSEPCGGRSQNINEP